MSYKAQANMARNELLRDRIAACAAQEGIPQKAWSNFGPEALMWAHTRMWQLSGEPGWADAWAYAQAAQPDDDPGDNEAVITDGMILAAVQPMLNDD